MPRSASAEPRFFRNAKAFRAWLEKNADSGSELIVGYYKVDSGKPSITWPESVDEALCFGWIDGVRKRIDDNAYQIRFTPRRSGSIWSAINIRKVEQLIAEGRMMPAGLKAFEQRTEQKSRVYSYEQDATAQLEPAELAKFRKHKAAWKYLEQLPPGHKRTMMHWITSAKRPETRAQRLEKFIDSCARGERMF